MRVRFPPPPPLFFDAETELAMKILIALSTLALLPLWAVNESAAAADQIASTCKSVATPQATPEQPLDADGVGALLDELKDTLTDLISSEDNVDAISEKWDGRKDLVGKTKSQILLALAADVRSVVADKATQNKVWKSWGAEAKSLEPPPIQAPTPVAQSPVKPNPNTQTNPISGTVIYFNADKGYGFIRPDRGGPDIFVHISSLDAAGINTLNPNDRVTFDIEVDKRGKSAAVHIKMAPE